MEPGLTALRAPRGRWLAAPDEGRRADAGEAVRRHGSVVDPRGGRRLRCLRPQRLLLQRFVIFGDLEAHTLRGELKASDGSVKRTMNRQANALNAAVTWRVVTHPFDLEPLAPGDYSLDLIVDDKPVGTYTFTLR
jgi:hypothetical protein